MRRQKILFVAEAVTLAHVGRPLALAATLEPERYEVHIACADGFDFCFRDGDPPRIRIHSISSAQFLRALATGRPVYDEATLTSYVEDDRRLLKALKPDLVLGDFRLSLSVSARLARVPYIALVNAYWSPYVRQHYTVPTLALSKILPIGIADALFRMARPLAFAAHAVPLNRVRRKYGLAPLGFDLRQVYTDADHTLYPDIPQLFPAHDLPANHSYLGPLIWSPPVAPPDWWDALDMPAPSAAAPAAQQPDAARPEASRPGAVRPETARPDAARPMAAVRPDAVRPDAARPDAARPIIYVTLGSSGQAQLLAPVLQALAPLPVTVLAATAGKLAPAAAPANARVAPFLPGEEAARRASLVICNGGSPTSQQALAAGVPLLGIAGNLDQFLNMHGVTAAGAGILLRADRFSEDRLRREVEAALGNVELTAAARKIAQAFKSYDAAERLSTLLRTLLGAA